MHQPLDLLVIDPVAHIKQLMIDPSDAIPSLVPFKDRSYGIHEFPVLQFILIGLVQLIVIGGTGKL